MDLDEALAWLLGEDRTGVMPDDDIAAAIISMRRRELNSQAGGAVLADLQRRINPATGRTYTLREIERATGIPRNTIAQWAHPPHRTAHDDQEQ